MNLINIIFVCMNLQGPEALHIPQHVRHLAQNRIAHQFQQQNHGIEISFEKSDCPETGTYEWQNDQIHIGIRDIQRVFVLTEVLDGQKLDLALNRSDAAQTLIMGQSPRSSKRKSKGFMKPFLFAIGGVLISGAIIAAARSRNSATNGADPSSSANPVPVSIPVPISPAAPADPTFTKGKTGAY